MADVCYDICWEHDDLTPATIAFGMQRQDDPDATPQQVHCYDWHEGQGAVTAALMRSRMVPARVFRKVLRSAASDGGVGRSNLDGTPSAGSTLQAVSACCPLRFVMSCT
jgi:hypothetical protein